MLAFLGPPYDFERRLILILSEKLAEFVSSLRENKTEALSVNSAIESSSYVYYLLFLNGLARRSKKQ